MWLELQVHQWVQEGLVHQVDQHCHWSHQLQVLQWLVVFHYYICVCHHSTCSSLSKWHIYFNGYGESTQLTSWRTHWSRDAIATIPPWLSWQPIPSRQSREGAGRPAFCFHSKVEEEKDGAKQGKVHDIKTVHSHSFDVRFWTLFLTNLAAGVLQAVHPFIPSLPLTSHTHHTCITFHNLLLPPSYHLPVFWGLSLQSVYPHA